MAQCVLGTLVDAYSKGYDCIVVEDCVATKSPPGGLENVLFNASGVRFKLLFGIPQDLELTSTSVLRFRHRLVAYHQRSDMIW